MLMHGVDVGEDLVRTSKTSAGLWPGTGMMEASSVASCFWTECIMCVDQMRKVKGKGFDVPSGDSLGVERTCHDTLRSLPMWPKRTSCGTAGELRAQTMRSLLSVLRMDQLNICESSGVKSFTSPPSTDMRSTVVLERQYELVAMYVPFSKEIKVFEGKFGSYRPGKPLDS